MNKALVFQHVPYEELGTLNGLLRAADLNIHTVEFWRADASPADFQDAAALIVMGGPMGVYEADKYPYLAAETKLIEGALKKELPVLGICLGSQLIAHALGARVYPSGIKEIGWYDLMPTADAANDPLLHHLRPGEKVFQWHGDTFDLPKGAVHLASSALCTNQAFRYGENAYALQFHLEVDGPMIDDWLEAPENRGELTALRGEIDPIAIRADTTRHIGRLENLSRRVFGDFIGLLNRSQP
jgi:GMP synthase (glutamine-hydrolysing)